MIYSLKGPILEKTTAEVVIECAGVGYLVAISAATAGALPPPGAEATLFTVMHVTENDVALYGFESREARTLFRLLTGVSGVGPKAGLAILGVMQPSALALAITAGDHKALTAAPGVGPKLAQRIVLELRDKLSKAELPGSINAADLAPVGDTPGSLSQAVAALVTLGYTQSEAAAALSGIDPGLPTAEIIRLALKRIGGK